MLAVFAVDQASPPETAIATATKPMRWACVEGRAPLMQMATAFATMQIRA
jgi:hypothetical protein